METIEDSYNFSDDFVNFLSKAAANDPTIQEQEIPEEDAIEPSEEDTPDEEDWKGKYDDLQNENETLKNQVADFRFAQNEAIQNDDLLYNAYNQGGNSSILNMVMGDEIEDVNFQTKSNKVSFANFDPTLKGYLNDLQNKFGNKIVVTSANDQEHATNSRHYKGEAVDLRFSPEVHKYIENDPLAKQLGLSVLNPNHGTAPHTHLQRK